MIQELKIDYSIFFLQLLIFHDIILIMKYVIDGIEYDVVINKKNNKNTYIRIKDNSIYITTNYFVSKHYIKSLLDNNYEVIKKMLKKQSKKLERNENFYFLNKKYDVIIVNTLDIEITDDKIFVKSSDYLNKWLKKKTSEIFKSRLDYIYNNYKEKIPYPTLRIRSMKTRWGVCNRKNNTVTLNSELIKYGYEQIDYVIIHELSHFIHFDHSKNFWLQVSKYCPNYKEIRKSLKEG